MNDAERDKLLMEMHSDLRSLTNAELPKRVGMLEQSVAKTGVWISLVSAGVVTGIGLAVKAIWAGGGK